MGTYRVKDYTWEDIEMLCCQIASAVESSDRQYSCIYGIPRGGLIPAVLLSHMLDIPMILNPFEISHPFKPVLIVDDIADSGITLEKFALNEYSDFFSIATIFWKKASSVKPTYFARHIPMDEWVVFPWETGDSDDVSGVTLEDDKIYRKKKEGEYYE